MIAYKSSNIIFVFLAVALALSLDSISSTSADETLKTLNSDKNGRLFTTITEPGASQQLPGLEGAGGLDFNVYNFFTSFVNQTRQTIPDIANHGNFTLIQLGLLGAIGALAAGAATIVAEAFIFRQHETDLAYYNLQKQNYHAPSASYGPPSSSYGAPASSYETPSLTYDSSPTDSYNVAHNRLSSANSRKKRDTGQEQGRPLRTYSYPQVIRSYGNDFQSNDASFPQPFFQNSQYSQKENYAPFASTNGHQRRPLSTKREDVLYQNQYLYQLMGMGNSKRRPGFSQRLKEKHHPIDSDMEYSRGLPVHHSKNYMDDLDNQEKQHHGHHKFKNFNTNRRSDKLTSNVHANRRVLKTRARSHIRLKRKGIQSTENYDLTSLFY